MATPIPFIALCVQEIKRRLTKETHNREFNKFQDDGSVRIENLESVALLTLKFWEQNSIDISGITFVVNDDDSPLLDKEGNFITL